MDVSPAEFFSGDFFSGSGFHQRRASEENGPVALYDDGFIRHGRNVSAPGRARAEHSGDLGDAIARHSSLIAENTTKVADVGKDFVLHGQEGPSRIDEVDTREVVFMGHGLSTYVFLDRHRVVGAPLDRGVVGHEEAFPSVHHANSSDDASRMGATVVEFVSGERREFEEGRTRVDDSLNAFPCKVLATGAVAFDVLPSTTKRGGFKSLPQL